MVRVVIPEHIPSKNRGEAAILAGILHSLMTCGDAFVTLFSPDCYLSDDREYYQECRVVSGLDLHDSAVPDDSASSLQYYGRWLRLLALAALSRISRRVARRFTEDELLKAFLEADVVLAGHDGAMGPGQGYLVLAARVMGKPVALFGGGENVLPKITWKTRWLLRFAVHHAILCTVRDCGSRDYLLANGVRSDKVFLFPDPAVLLQPCSADRAREILGAEGITTSPDRPLAGLVAASNNAVPRHCFSAERTREGKHRRHVEFWIQMVLHLLDTTNAHLVFIPHCMGPEPTNDDRSTARDIVGALPRGRDRVTAVETEYTAGELKGLMGACDFVISERAHALIGAFSVGTPCLALGVVEDSRMHNIMEKMFGVPVFDINDPSADELRALVTDLWNRRRETAAHMAPDVERVRQEALLAAQLLKERIAAALEARA